MVITVKIKYNLDYKMEGSMREIMEDIIKYDKNDSRRNNNKKRDFFMRALLFILSLISLITIIYFYCVPSLPNSVSDKQ